MANDIVTYPMFPFNADALATLQRRHVDTLILAGRIVSDGLRAATKHQNERMQASVRQWLDAGRQAVAAPMPYWPADSLKDMRTAFQHSLEDANAIASLLLETHTEAARVVTQGVLTNVGDMMTPAKTA